MTNSRKLAPHRRTVDAKNLSVERATFLHFGAERSSIRQRRGKAPEEFKA